MTAHPNPPPSFGQLPKGAKAEEALRRYFLSLGYYVVRGIPLRIDQFDVTDVDLWLYHRPSPLIRTRSIVDIKNKRTPQAIERLFWTMGLQRFLGVDMCMVATTDRRPQIVSLGEKYGITVLDGTTTRRLIERAATSDDVQSFEGIVSLLRTDHSARIADGAVREIKEARSLLLNKMDFDGVNQQLLAVQRCMNACLVNPPRSGSLLRALYLHIGMLLTTLDYATAMLSFTQSDRRRTVLEAGLKYGKGGDQRIRQVAKLTAALVGHYSSAPVPSESQILRDLDRGSSTSMFQILAEYFSQQPTHTSLVEQAIRFDSAAHDLATPYPRDLPPRLKSTLFVLADSFDLARGRLAELFPTSSGPADIGLDSASSDLRQTLLLRPPEGPQYQAAGADIDQDQAPSEKIVQPATPLHPNGSMPAESTDKGPTPPLSDPPPKADD